MSHAGSYTTPRENAIIGEAIRAARRQRRMSCSELARRIGIDSSLMSRIERGMRPLHPHRYPSIERELGVSPASVLGNGHIYHTIGGIRTGPIIEAIVKAIELEPPSVSTNEFVSQLVEHLDGIEEARIEGDTGELLRRIIDNAAALIAYGSTLISSTERESTHG